MASNSEKNRQDAFVGKTKEPRKAGAAELIDTVLSATGIPAKALAPLALSAGMGFGVISAFNTANDTAALRAATASASKFSYDPQLEKIFDETAKSDASDLAVDSVADTLAATGTLLAAFKMLKRKNAPVPKPASPIEVENHADAATRRRKKQNGDIERM